MDGSDSKRERPSAHVRAAAALAAAAAPQYHAAVAVVIPRPEKPATIHAEAKLPSLSYVAAVGLATHWMLHVKEITSATKLDETYTFVDALRVIIATLAQHVRGKVPHPGVVIDHDTYLAYWINAPLAHRQFIARFRPRYTLVEWAWLAYAHGQAAEHPKAIHRRLVYSADAKDVYTASLELDQVCNQWPSTGHPLVPPSIAWPAHIAFAVFRLGDGVKNMMIPPPPPPLPGTKEKMTDGVSATVQLEAHRQATNTRRSMAMHQWIPLVTRVWGYTELMGYLTKHSPIVSVMEAVNLPALEEVRRAIQIFITHRSRHTITKDDFKRAVADIGFRMRMPVGANDLHRRDPSAAAATNSELYRARIVETEPNDEAADARVAKIQTGYDTKLDVLYDIGPVEGNPYTWTALVLHLYAFWFDQSIRGVEFMRRFVVLSDDILAKVPLVTTTMCGALRRSPLIVQLGASWFVHTNHLAGTPRFIQANDILTALALWTYIVGYHDNTDLDSGHEIGDRWLKNFL